MMAMKDEQTDHIGEAHDSQLHRSLLFLITVFLFLSQPAVFIIQQRLQSLIQISHAFTYKQPDVRRAGWQSKLC